MERFKELNRFQKGVLLVMLLMIVVFIGIYIHTMSTVGFLYRGELYVPKKDGDKTVYSASLNGVDAKFTVTDDGLFYYQYANTTYGPYSVQPAPDAIPKGHSMEDQMEGVAIYKGNSVVFQGGVVMKYPSITMFTEKGTLVNPVISVSSGESLAYNLQYGVEPSLVVVLALLDNPVLTHKGDWWGLIWGSILCLMNAVSILFADAPFRRKLHYQIRNVEDAEPSKWELSRRYIVWCVVPLVALIVLISGLG